MTDAIMTLQEVAKYLKVSEKTVYSLSQRGELPAIKVGQQWRFKLGDLEQWLEQQKRSKAPSKSSRKTATKGRRGGR